MKKVITTIALAIIMVAGTNAQIKKPTVKVNTTSIKTNTNLQGLKVSNLKKLKSVADFKKLDIPVIQLTQEMLNKKPIKTWKIGPRQLDYANFKLDYFYGLTKDYKWVLSSKVDSGGSGDSWWDQILLEIIEDFENDSWFFGDWRNFYDLFPIKLKFRVSGGVDYRLTINPIDFQGEGLIEIIVNKEYVYRVRNISSHNSQKGFIFDFKEDTSKEISIHFSSIYITDGSAAGRYNPMVLSEIKIEKLENEE